MRPFYLLLFISSFLHGQKLDKSIYDFSTHVLNKKDDVNASEIFSCIGDYQLTLSTWDKKSRPSAPLSPADSLYFKGFKAVDAIDYISEMAVKEQIIIINEAHHQPYHRAFSTSILKTLYEKGFRYFGAETLTQADTLLNERKYPVQSSGYYTKEPVYGNLIRTALEIGFTVFAYETTRMKNDSNGINLREIEQAKNIQRILDKDPSAKIFIHCGYDHIVESDYPGWGKAMAGRLFEYTAINPFTIDQVKLTERSAKEFENPFFGIADNTKYSFFVDSAGQLFNGPKNSKQHDARLYLPKTVFESGRPNWLFNNTRKPFLINKRITLSYPCLVFAYLQDELAASKDDAIPFDVIELKSESEMKALSLKKGKYCIMVYSKNNQTQKIELTF